MRTMPADTVRRDRCTDCRLERVVVAEAMGDDLVRLTVLQGCTDCEGSHLTLAR